MQAREQVVDRAFGVGPIAITILSVVLIAGLGLGSFAFAGRDAHPTVGVAQISSDGSICIVHLVNHGSTDLHLNSLLLSTGDSGNAVSFASGFMLPRNSTTDYDCELGSHTQFVPPLSFMHGGRFNLTARLDDGTQMRISSQFA